MKRVILSFLVGLIAVNLYGQQGNIFGNYEIGLSASGGLSALHFSTTDGRNPSYSAGYVLGWDFAILFTEKWSFRTGINMASYYASVSFDRMKTRNLTVTPKEGGLPANSSFYVVTEYREYEELHEALYLRFPLMVQYRMGKYFYAAAGIQTGILANGTYRIKSGELVTEGYSDFTWQLYDDIPEHGFDIYSNIKSTNKPDFGIALSGALETGVKWGLNNGMALYTGVFLDYGLNDIRKSSPTKESIVYDENGAHTFNSILYSKNEGTPMTGKVQPLAVGLRMRLSMGFGI